MSKLSERDQHPPRHKPSVKTSRDRNAGDSLVAAFFAVHVGVALVPLRRPRPTLRNVPPYPKSSKQKHTLKVTFDVCS